MKKKVVAGAVLMGIVMLSGAFMFAPAVFAQDEDAEEGVEAAAPTSTGDGLRVMGLGIGAGLAIGIAGFATGTAQAGVGAGGTGALAEKPELFINILILFAIPETIVIFGLVIAVLLINNI